MQPHFEKYDRPDKYKKLVKEVLVHDVNDEQRIALYQHLIKNDLYFLLRYILNRPDVENDWYLARCREVQNSPNGHIDLWAREHGKSTIITYALTIQDIINDPEITVGLFSHTRPIAKSFLRQIKRELEQNEILKTLFPDILYKNPASESPSWSEDGGITVKRKGNTKESTVEAWGLVDGQPTGRHFRLRVYDDVVTRENVTTAEQVKKTTEAFELSDNLGVMGGHTRIIGTRYCTIGSTLITMADWTQKPISEVKVGDEIVGWNIGKHNKRYLIRSKVLSNGSHPLQQTFKYLFDNGRSVTCTPDHLWWRGAHWASYGKDKIGKKGNQVSRGREYSPLGFGHHEMKSIRQLLVPVKKDLSWEAGWLAGFFDGEGTVKKNKHHPSGLPSFTQSIKNQVVIDKFSEVMGKLSFSYNAHICNQGDEKNSKSFHYNITGGWDERYRFVASICPSRISKLAETLYGQLHTDKIVLSSIEDSGLQNVYWLETETGNYVADGFCSKNSLNDTYASILTRNIAAPRIYPATHNGRVDGRPVLFDEKEWERRKRTQSRRILAAQLLQNPLADEDAKFQPIWLTTYEVRPSILNIAIMGDPSLGRHKESDNTAIVVIGYAKGGVKYLLDGVCHRMSLSQRWTALRDLYVKWSDEIGVQSISVGWERYGVQSDIEYFEERMRIDKPSVNFAIEELNWVHEGGQAKQTRIERLEPDFRNRRFLLPLAVWHDGQPKTFKVDDDPESKTYQSVVYSEFRGLTKKQNQYLESGQADLLACAIKNTDNEKQIYDLTVRFIEEYMQFPFGAHDDLLDAASRFFDMEMVEPAVYARATLEQPVFHDS